MTARIAILRQHLGADAGLDLEAFGDTSDGFTGAMVEKVARNATDSGGEPSFHVSLGFLSPSAEL